MFVDLADPDLAAAEAQLADAASAHDGDATTPDARRRHERRTRHPIGSTGAGSRYGCFAAYSTADIPGLDAGAVSLSLISHTNAGKTTLARTLLGRDVGEVRDAPHVTAEATPYPLVQTADGDLLTLWDTPGFGDSVRLARRLRQDRNPIGWFLSQVWDRYQDRALWLSQLAVRNVAEQADVVLYLVNAAEAPADAGYLASELEVLEWIGKPVLVLLNQTGPPRERSAEEADAARWRAALADVGPRARGARVRRVRPLLGAGVHAVRRRSNRWFRMPRGRPSPDCRPPGATSAWTSSTRRCPRSPGRSRGPPSSA